MARSYYITFTICPVEDKEKLELHIKDGKVAYTPTGANHGWAFGVFTKRGIMKMIRERLKHSKQWPEKSDTPKS